MLSADALSTNLGVDVLHIDATHCHSHTDFTYHMHCTQTVTQYICVINIALDRMNHRILACLLQSPLNTLVCSLSKYEISKGSNFVQSLDCASQYKFILIASN